MKATGTIEASKGLWYAPNTGATNESGFTALPGGFREPNDPFVFLGCYAIFWSSTENRRLRRGYIACHIVTHTRSHSSKFSQWAIAVVAFRVKVRQFLQLPLPKLLMLLRPLPQAVER